MLLLIVLWLHAQLPLAVSRWVGAAWGLLVYHVNDKRRGIAHVNLSLCFPDLGHKERETLVRRHFIAAGKSTFDLGFLSWASRRRLQRKIHVTGLEYFREQLAQGRNVILLAPHFVGMNVGGAFLAKEHTLFSMVKAQRNEVINWLLTRSRTRFSGRPIVRQSGLRPVIKGIRRGETFYYLPDEDFGAKRSVFVPFFGVPTATLPTLGRMAELTDAVVLPCFTRLLPGGQGYEIIVQPPISHFPSGDRIKDAARMNEVIEAGVRQMPEQYMWTFKLFKTRPDNAPSPY